MPSLDEFDDPVEYELDFILKNPIDAKCVKCKRQFSGREAIKAPSLSNCRCFYCGGQLAPLSKTYYEYHRIEVEKHRVPRQGSLPFNTNSNQLESI